VGTAMGRSFALKKNMAQVVGRRETHVNVYKFFGPAYLSDQMGDALNLILMLIQGTKIKMGKKN
jgi:hypothetical protein